jgi:hypothetical protein
VEPHSIVRFCWEHRKPQLDQTGSAQCLSLIRDTSSSLSPHRQASSATPNDWTKLPSPMTVPATRFWLTSLCRPFSTPTTRSRGAIRTWRSTPTLRYPNLTFRARAQLVRRSHRSMMHAAQSRPRDENVRPELRQPVKLMVFQILVIRWTGCKGLPSGDRQSANCSRVPPGCTHSRPMAPASSTAKLGKGDLSRRTGHGRALLPVPEELSGRSSLARQIRKESEIRNFVDWKLNASGSPLHRDAE